MGLENMRRWPMYIVFAICFLLLLSLFNSWTVETELRDKYNEVSKQLRECSKQQSSCMEESLSLLEQRDNYVVKINDLDKQKVKLTNDVSDMKLKLLDAKSDFNRTKVDVDLCKTELQSLKNLQVSKSATLEALRLEKERLNEQLSEKKQKIEDLLREVEKLKTMTTKSSIRAPSPAKVTSAAQPLKQSPALELHESLNEPVLENNAKEEMEDPIALNDNNFDLNGQT